ncbi:TetR/AcrR family transcriptional regulator [Pediococcus argentinicus]|uniref:HTH tetR-type domain-containing protein n=1 Tax=Pediococcus argentinicus TaxID=480391 RepID=A0A0R2NJJ8_9LACO|nr:TetR/AcrR family transcriptional regulator [Pediococcus argentinicus]KRO25944.1 hypothetical protein IV88_GL001211 [Pediococcus argentinicus]NKZ21805.1 TetR/AcrR family transcriptional regulator [Pediococcus argentinicus]GEP18935.1 TetR family transcriptional regulator [Pediococcus argentinicus]
MGYPVKPLKRTQRDLVEAMVNLLRKEPFEKITIDDVCDEALVHRSTFYRYYHNKYELLESMLEYTAYIFFVEKGELEDDRSFVTQLIKMISQEPIIFQNLTINNEFFDSYSQLLDIVSQIILKGITNQHEHDDLSHFPLFHSLANSKNVNLSVHIFSGAILTIFMEWIKLDNSNEQTLTDMIDNLMHEFPPLCD